MCVKVVSYTCPSKGREAGAGEEGREEGGPSKVVCERAHALAQNTDQQFNIAFTSEYKNVKGNATWVNKSNALAMLGRFFLCKILR